MELYPNSLDPSETKDYVWDWSDRLQAGETVQSHAVSFADAAGTTSPSNAVSGNTSRVWLTGGTPGKRAIWTILATTNKGRTLKAAFAVDIVDVLIGAEPQTTLERLQAHREKLLDADRASAELKAAYALRSKIISGEAITELWRDGRRIRKVVPTLAELNSHIQTLEREVASANAVAAGGNRRRAIGIAYRN